MISNNSSNQSWPHCGLSSHDMHFVWPLHCNLLHPCLEIREYKLLLASSAWISRCNTTSKSPSNHNDTPRRAMNWVFKDISLSKNKNSRKCSREINLDVFLHQVGSIWWKKYSKAGINATKNEENFSHKLHFWELFANRLKGGINHYLRFIFTPIYYTVAFCVWDNLRDV